MGKQYLMSEEDMIGYTVLNNVISGFISLKEATDIHGISYRQAIRLKKRFMDGLLENSLRTPQFKDEIIGLRKTVY
ncbi:MAG: hypothetical protein LDL13_06660 [Calditerrivibrio sp.]|nr:hypothetical protein [Calditerrivibrio sp.]